MADLVLPVLPQEIISKIISLVGKDSFWYLAPFISAGKLGYRLVYEPSVLQTCNINPMFIVPEPEIGIFEKFNVFFQKCVTVDNTDVVYYEGLKRATFVGLEESIDVLQVNVPTPDLSTLAVGIFDVCLGNDKEATKVFQEFALIHDNLKSDAILELAGEIEWRLLQFEAPYLNTYAGTFKFPDDNVIKSPKCQYGHDYTNEFEGSCKNCRLFWIWSNISHML